MNNFSAMSCREQITFQWDDDDVHFLLDQHASLDYFNTSSLKQQSLDKHVTPTQTINMCTLSWFWAINQSLLLLLNDMGLEEK
jgi:hypothetical protein